MPVGRRKETVSTIEKTVGTFGKTVSTSVFPKVLTVFIGQKGRRMHSGFSSCERRPAYVVTECCPLFCGVPIEDEAGNGGAVLLWLSRSVFYLDFFALKVFLAGEEGNVVKKS